VGRALRVCPVTGCPNLVERGTRYCDAHERERQQRVDAKRPPSSQRGYGPQWQATRAEYLAHNPMCAVCGEKATQVHHVVSLRAGGTNEWSNLQSLCHSCHSRHTAKHDGGFGNG
jgi:5-methylcytosine-specific restriction protein A